MEDLNKLGCQIKDVDQFEAEEELEEEDDDIEEVDDTDLEFEIETAKDSAASLEEHMEEQKMIKTSRVKFKRLNCSAHKVHLCG